MTVLTAGTVATIATAGAAAPLAAAATTSAAAAAGTGAAAVAGTAGTVVAGSAAVGGAVGGVGAGTAGILGCVASGPVGWLLLGTDQNPQDLSPTFDCWKPVLRDESPEPSKGRLLRDVVMDSRIKHLIPINDMNDLYPQFILENIWDEQFRIEYVTLPSNVVTAHALPLN